MLAEFHRDKGHGPDTVRKYKAVLERFGDGPMTSDTLAEYRDARLAAGKSRPTVRGELCKLLCYARWQGLRVHVALPPWVERAPTAWSVADVRRLLLTAHRSKLTIYGVPGSVYYPALLGLAIDTGARRGELLQLRLADIDLRGRAVVFRAESRKGQSRDKIATFTRPTARAVARLLQHANGQERPFALGDGSTLYKSYKRLLAEAGLPNDRWSLLHKLRRTHATWLHARGGDATASLGHASDATTRAHYIDVRQLRRPRLPNPLGWLGWMW